MMADGYTSFLHPATILFIFAAISDFLDGFLARKLNAESDFGVFFDNIADKMLNIAIICVLIKLDRVLLIPAIIVILREILISSFREYMAMRQNRKINVEFLGKLKTAFQFISLPILIQPSLLPYFSSQTLFLTGNILFGISAIMSVLSGFLYLSVFIKK